MSLKISDIATYGTITLGNKSTIIESNTATGYLKLFGSGSNYVAVGAYNNNGWGYLESVSNSSGLYFSVSGGRYAFDTGNITPYDDGEVSVGSPTHRWSNMYTSGWYRSYGSTGLYNETHGGGIYMIDSTWVRTYNNKSFYSGGDLNTAGYIRHSDSTLAVTEYAGSVSTPNDWPSCTENARIYTIGTLNSGGGQNSYIEIEVIGSHRGYTPASYFEYKKWIISVGDRISSNMIASAGNDNNVALWNGTDSLGLKGVYGDHVANGWVLRLIVNPSCGSGKSYTVRVKYSNLSMTHGPFTYTNYSSYNAPTIPRSGSHTSYFNAYSYQPLTIAAGNGVTLTIADGGDLQINSQVSGSNSILYNDYGTLNCTTAFTSAGDVTAFSDIRLKENIELITNPIEKLSKLRGVTFNRNDADDKERRFAGVIAQEVIEVLPEVVSKEGDGYYSVAYGNMVGLLIEAIKEQQKQINELKSLINK